MLVDQVNGALNTFLDERKKEKTLTMRHIDEIVKIYNSVKTPSHDYSNAVMNFNQYKGTLLINFQDLKGDLIDIKIQDYYSAIKLLKHGTITTTGHITIFHFMQPIIPYSNINLDLTFRKLTTPEKSNIGKRLISKLSECEATFLEPAFREGNSPDMQAPYLRVINGVIPRDLDLTNITKNSYNIIIFSETSDDNKEITIKTIHPITIISYNSNVNIKLIYANPPNDNCPKIEPVNCPKIEPVNCPKVAPVISKVGPGKPVAEFINSIDNIFKTIYPSDIYIEDIDKLMNEYKTIDPEDVKKVTGKEFNMINFRIKSPGNISDVETDVLIFKSDRFSEIISRAKRLNAIKQTSNNETPKTINVNNVKCHLCVFSVTHPKFPYSNLKMNIKLNKKDNINVNSPSSTQKLVNYVVAKLYPLSLKTNSILVFHDRPTTIPSEKRDLPAQIDLTDVNSPDYSILIFDNINNKNVIINTIHPITIMSLDSDINIQLTYLNPYIDGPKPLCPAGSACPACADCPACKTLEDCPKPTCPMCKKCASCGKKKK
jgi:hypothetical protein